MSNKKAEIKLTNKKSKMKLFESYNKYSTEENRYCKRKTSHKNEYWSGRSNIPWEADISDSPEENDRMDQENSCVTGNKLTDCDIDAHYYY